MGASPFRHALAPARRYNHIQAMIEDPRALYAGSADATTEVGWFLSPEEALIACGFLRAQGIPASVDSVDHAQAQPHIQLALGGTRIYAPHEYADDARKLLAEVNAHGEEQCAKADTAGAFPEGETSSATNNIARTGNKWGHAALLYLFAALLAWAYLA